jgi:hypothetical protein
MKRLLMCFVAMLFMICIITPLHAGPVTVDAGWYGFCFAGDGSPATAGCQNDGIDITGNTITFEAITPVLFKITDAFDYGDTFDVWINLLLSFTTPTVAVGGGSVSNPDLAFADPGYSHGSLLLAAGSYSINILVNYSPWSGGGAYLEVETASVPEPTTMLLLGLGFVGLAGMRRRMHK